VVYLCKTINSLLGFAEYGEKVAVKELMREKSPNLVREMNLSIILLPTLKILQEKEIVS
jgi:hypothetical protein